MDRYGTIEGPEKMIFGDIKELMEKNSYYRSQDRLSYLLYAEDVVPTLAREKRKTEEEIEAELRFVLEYAGTFCSNLQGISIRDFLINECQFTPRPSPEELQNRFEEEKEKEAAKEKERARAKEKTKDKTRKVEATSFSKKTKEDEKQTQKGKKEAAEGNGKVGKEKSSLAKEES